MFVNTIQHGDRALRLNNPSKLKIPVRTKGTVITVKTEKLFIHFFNFITTYVFFFFVIYYNRFYS